MLDRNTRKVFKYIYKTRKNLSISSLRKQFSNFPSLIESYQLLIDEKLIINRNGSIELTNKGNDYYHEKFINTIKFLILSIIVPIVVAYITTLFASNNNQCCNETNNNRNTNTSNNTK